MFKLKTEQEGEHPLFVDERLIEALAEVVKGEGCSILIRPNPFHDNSIMVDISYGNLVRDGVAAASFDTAEFGVDTGVEKALRYALGAHFGSTEEVYG